MNWIEADNESGGFHGELFDYLKQYGKQDGSVYLVSETEKVIPVFQDYFPEITFVIAEKFVDLNVLQPTFKTKSKVDVVFAQALLEHICRPCVAIENFCGMVKSGGYIILHTHNNNMGYHAYPVDCCRFFKDYFVALCKYLPVKVSEYDEWNEHIAVCYRRV